MIKTNTPADTHTNTKQDFMNLFKTASMSAILLLSVGISACDNNSPAASQSNSKANNETTEQSEESGKPSSGNNIISTDTTLAKVTLQSVLESVKTPLQSEAKLDEPVLTCINNISEDFALEAVQNFFNKRFSHFELDELNSFYKTEEAIAYTNYGRDQVLIASGVSLKDPADKPKKKEIEKIDAFSKSELGQKYITITQTTGDDSLTSLVMPLLTDELNKCGLPI